MSDNLNVVNGLPTYGNWGGPGWSAGGTNSGILTEEQKRLPYTDVLDALFKDHDIAYDEAEKISDPERRAKAILDADLDLLGGMWLIDLGSLDVVGQSYREAAIDLFKVKIITGFMGWGFNFNIKYPFGMGVPISALYQAARTILPRTDPLTLDLDGDGLETVGINPTFPILFDHDADGVKTASGWIKADDAFLVIDRNANGVIDSGRELFGDNTLLNGGGLAADGFAALAQEDSNADGLVNASDAHWSNLRLWRDLNQDGSSQGNELYSLDTHNITALKVAKTANSQTLANGNQIADLGGYLKADGSQGTLGEVTGHMGDINLASNPFYRQFGDKIPLTAAAARLPGMKGSGAVRDLPEAASLNAALIADVNGLAGATRRQMLDQLDTLIQHWAANDDQCRYAA